MRRPASLVVLQHWTMCNCLSAVASTAAWAPLARLEAQVALPALFRRSARLALGGAPELRDNLNIKGS